MVNCPVAHYYYGMRTALAGIAMLAAVATGGASAARADGSTPATAEPFRLEYRVDFGNLRVIEAEVRFDVDSNRYEITGSGMALGPLAWYSEWRGETRTVGRIDGNRLLPTLHQNSGSWRGENRSAMLKYLGLADISVSTEPPPDPIRVTAVPPETIPGTVDPLSAILQLLSQVAETGSCQGQAEVFDGRRRYDLLVSDRGTATLPADRPWDFRGLGRLCALKSARIGGFWRDREGRADENAERVVWLAPLQQGLWVPVRMEFPAPIGSIIGRAVRPGASADG